MRYPDIIYICRNMNMTAHELLRDDPRKTCPYMKTGKCDDGYKCHIVKYKKVKEGV